MLKSIVIGIAIFSFYIALQFLFSKRRDDKIIDAATMRRAKSFREMLPFLIVGVALFAVAIFFFSRLGLNVGGLFQKILAVLPFIRGFLPF